MFDLGTTDFMNKTYSVYQWETNDEIPELLEEPFIAIDTETELIVDGEPHKPVIGQFCLPNSQKVFVAYYTDLPALVDYCLKTCPSQEWVFFNAAFDTDILGIKDKPLLRQHFIDGHITDTMIRYCLSELSQGIPVKAYNLATAVNKLLDQTLTKDKKIRLTFKQNQFISNEHLIYACEDAIATAELRKILHQPLPTEYEQLLGTHALHFVSKHCFLVDEERRQELEDKFQEKIDYYNELLSVYGYYPGVKNNTLVLQEILSNFQDLFGITFPKTEKTGKFTTSEDQLKAVFDDANIEAPAFIEAYNGRAHYHKMVSTYLKKDEIGPDGRVHSFFNCFQRTLRTGSSGPNIQNPPRAEGLRGIYVAPNKHLLCATDYSQLELCILAEHCYQRYGFSKMRELINQGVDLHTYMGKKVAEAEGVDWRKLTKSEFKKLYRAVAKICAFGFPGGMRAKTFVEYAKGYGITLSLEKSKLLEQVTHDTYPELAKLLNPDLDFENTKLQIRQWLYQNKKEWQEHYDEANLANIETIDSFKDFLTELYEQIYAPNSKEFFKAVYGTINRVSRFTAYTITGFNQPNCFYCAACNFAFQSPAAVGAKYVLGLLELADYFMVDFIHDEIIDELPIDKQILNYRIPLKENIMVKGMKRVAKNTAIRVESALMDRWYKEAEPVLGASGNFLPWEPEIVVPDDSHSFWHYDTIDLNKFCKKEDILPLYNPDGSLFGYAPQELYQNKYKKLL